MDQRIHEPARLGAQWPGQAILPLPYPVTDEPFAYAMEIRPVEDRHGCRDYGHWLSARTAAPPLLSIRSDDDTGRLIVVEGDRVADVSWLLPSADMRRLSRGSYEARLSIVSGDEFAVIATFRFVVA